MHVTTFTSAVQALLENDAATARGLPAVSYSSPPHLPIGLLIPIIVSVWAEAGEDLDPRFVIMAHDPDGELRGRLEQRWHWPDTPGKPFKFQVFTEYLELQVVREGFYRIGLYDRPDQTETNLWFPVEVYVDPLAPAPGPPPSIT